MKKAIALSLAAVFCLVTTGISFAAEKEAVKPAATAIATGPANVMAAKPKPRASISMLYGALVNIDRTDPAKIKLEVKNEADNTTHIVELAPTANVIKVTDISELKPGENVRVMARKVDDKEVAMNVMFGKIKKPAPRPARPIVTMPPPAAAAKEQAQSKAAAAVPLAQKQPKK